MNNCKWKAVEKEEKKMTGVNELRYRQKKKSGKIEYKG